MSTKNKTILITGATAGIGRDAAIHLARRGHRVIATGRNEGALERLRADAGVALETLRLDVTSPDSIARAAGEVERLTGGRGLDALVNNAGYGQAGPLEEISDEDLRAQFETNVFGLMAVTRAFLPRMRERGAGRIVNVSSIGGRVTFPMFGRYHASRYAVEALSDALRNELAAFGIEVILIEPGAIRSEFSNRSIAAIEKYKSASSPYAAIYAKAQQIQAFSESQAAGPECVSRGIERAITARWPRARYVMPGSARVLLRAAALIPTRVADAILRSAIGLTRRGLAAGRAASAAAPAAPAPTSEKTADAAPVLAR